MTDNYSALIHCKRTSGCNIFVVLSWEKLGGKRVIYSCQQIFDKSPHTPSSYTILYRNLQYHPVFLYFRPTHQMVLCI